jgi:8-oxo-dGTP diphosphatase
MRSRPTARVLLLDPEDRVLLMKGRLPSQPDGPSFWFAIGGGVEPGESVRQAAAREIVEETGLTDAVLGAVAWYREVIMADAEHEPWLFQEHYLVARTQGGPLSRTGWLPHEHALTDELRWWTLDELRRTDETVFPEAMAELLAPILGGDLPSDPIVLPPADGRLER